MIPSLALRTFAQGVPIVLLDDERDEPSRLVVAAESLTTEWMAFVVRYTCGFVTVALPAARCDELGLPALVADPFSISRPIAGVSFDAAGGISTGISAADRSHSARLVTHSDTGVDDLCRPGHLVPMRVPFSGRARLASATAASLVLCEFAGVALAAVCCELVEDSGGVICGASARRFASRHGVPLLLLSELVGCPSETRVALGIA